MRRGEIWTIAGGGAYTGKPRPVVIVQDDAYGATESVTVCPLTTSRVDTPLIRPQVEPTLSNGLRTPSRLMADKLTTAPRTRLGDHIGRLSEADMVRLNRAMLAFLGLARSLRPSATSRRP